MTLLADEKREIANQVQDQFGVVWLPGVSCGRESDGSSVATQVLLFISGLVLAGVVKPFFEAMAKEAGKDFWSGVKTLIARMWKKQTDKGYKNETRVCLVFELAHDHVAIKLRLPMSSSVDDYPPLWFETEVEKTLADVNRDWDSILADIQGLGIGQGQSQQSLGSEKMIHIITKHDNRWMITPCPSVEFYKESLHYVGETRNNKYSDI